MQKNRGISTITLLVIIFLVVTVVMPLGSLLVHMTQVDVISFLSSPVLRRAAVNSALVSVVATLISVGLSMALAFCMMRSHMPFKPLFNILLTLPMLIPSMSHGLGLIVLLGNNGVLTRLFGLSWSIYGFWGIVIGSVMYTFPIAYLMFADILSYEDTAAYDAASILGIPKWRQFVSIGLPYLRKPLIVISFAIFAAIVTDFGVPLMVGGRFMTLPVLMYHEVIGLLNFGRGSVIGVLLLVPAIISFSIDVLIRERGAHDFVTQFWQGRKSKLLVIFSTMYCVFISVLVILPILASALLVFVRRYPIDMTPTFANVTRAFDRGLGGHMLNSLYISVVAAFLGVLLSYVAAYLTARVGGSLSRIMHLFSLATLAIPGMVLGISYAIFFRGSIISGTFAILILVNITHFFSYAYLMAYNSFGKLNENIESVGMTLGIKRFLVLKDIIFPQTLPSVLEMFCYLFVNSMITISAVAFLHSARNMPVSLMIAVFDSQMLFESAATVSVAILLVNISIKGLIYIAKKRAAI